jgi:hypothetical protein
LEDDMSSNLTYYSNSTPLLLMYPLHWLCCEVETVLLSPFSLHTERDPPNVSHNDPRHPRCSRLLNIATSIVVSFLLNVVNSIRFPTRIRTGVVLVFFPSSPSPTPFRHPRTKKLFSICKYKSTKIQT